MLGAHHLPELRADLVAALATLNVKNLTHFVKRVGELVKETEVYFSYLGFEEEVRFLKRDEGYI